jgi:hypothetical protein
MREPGREGTSGMKLVCSNGRVLTVRDVGPVLYEIESGSVPLPLYFEAVMEDEEARELLKDLRGQFGHKSRAVK